MKKIVSRVGVGLSVLALCVGVSGLALAESGTAPQKAHAECSGEHGGNRSAADRAAHAAERFKKADKNADGFLTQDEVGEKRWSRIQVADVNKDGKISQAELMQAHADGKLGHGKHQKQPA